MKRKLLIAVAVLLVVTLVGMRVAEVFRSANISATHSAAAQLHQDLNKSGQKEGFTNDWRVLNDNQYNRLLASLISAGLSFDAPSRWKTPNGKLVDAWGHRFQIAARRKASGEAIEFVVWSAGPDGQSGTDDDIVVPERRSTEVCALLQNLSR